MRAETRGRPLRRTASAVLLAVFLAASAPVAPAVAQEPIRVDGTVMWVSGQTLTLALDGPIQPTFYLVGPYLTPGPGQRPTINVDLGRVPQDETAFMRQGEHVGVIGVVSSDRRRIIGVSIIRAAPPQGP